MNTTKEQRKEVALRYMKELDIFKPYVKGYRDSNKVCFFENYAGFWVYQEPMLANKMKEIEEKYNCTVYAITHEYIDCDECYSFLIVTNNESEWSDLLYKDGNKFYAFAYVWNKTDDYYSEFGDVYISSLFGGIKRIA